VQFAVVILAAGASSRMGQPKLLLPWKNGTVLAHLLQLWTDLEAAQIAVVIAPNSPLDAHVGEADEIVNPRPELGMFSSVQSAASWGGWKEALTHFAVTLGDQPHVGIDTLRHVMDYARENPEYICQPARKGRGRHPVVLPRDIFRKIANSDQPNLKSFLQNRQSERRMFEMDDAALDLDIDTPEDYERALQFSKRL
jgi:molybdenum cofactor cytidylyltransferase